MMNIDISGVQSLETLEKFLIQVPELLQDDTLNKVMKSAFSPIAEEIQAKAPRVRGTLSASYRMYFPKKLTRAVGAKLMRFAPVAISEYVKNVPAYKSKKRQGPRAKKVTRVNSLNYYDKIVQLASGRRVDRRFKSDNFDAQLIFEKKRGLFEERLIKRFHEEIGGMLKNMLAKQIKRSSRALRR